MTDTIQRHRGAFVPSYGEFCLRMVTGPAAGKSWVLSEPETLIGRALGCHIRIEDPRVSRIQCELHLENGGVRMRNAGQRNPTLVNGVVREEARLAPGDIVFFAALAFILDRANVAGADLPRSPADSRTTQTFSDTVHIREEFNPTAYEEDPNLTVDLHQLLGLLRSLGQAESLESLVGRLTTHLGERFETDEIWLAWRLRTEEELVLYPAAPPEKTYAAPSRIMREACANAAGVMIPRAGSRDGEYAAAAPLIHGGESFGALAVRRPDAKGPFTANDLQFLVAVAECCAPLIRAAERLDQMQRDVHSAKAFDAHPTEIFSSSPAMQALLAEIRRAAVARVNVIVQGETGVGKEYAARMLHDLSARCSGPYIAVNSASLSPELFESEMFGHERGAFTGAARRRKGLFELAHCGTLFLDEITELSLANQAHLLRVTESGTFRPVGSEKELKVDVRIVCATNRPLPDKDQVYFRSDLYHRLAGVVVRIKPLRERREDIAALASHFLSLAAPHAPMHPKGFTKEATDRLAAYDWPGNIRELHNVVERACYMAQAEYITSGDLCLEDAGPAVPPQRSGVVSLDEIERQHLLEMLHIHGNSVIKVAQALGISRSAVYYKLARHGIKPRELGE